MSITIDIEPHSNHREKLIDEAPKISMLTNGRLITILEKAKIEKGRYTQFSDSLIRNKMV